MQVTAYRVHSFVDRQYLCAAGRFLRSNARSLRRHNFRLASMISCRNIVAAEALR